MHKWMKSTNQQNKEKESAIAIAEKNKINEKTHTNKLHCEAFLFKGKRMFWVSSQSLLLLVLLFIFLLDDLSVLLYHAISLATRRVLVSWTHFFLFCAFKAYQSIFTSLGRRSHVKSSTHSLVVAKPQDMPKQTKKYYLGCEHRLTFYWLVEECFCRAYRFSVCVYVCASLKQKQQQAAPQTTVAAAAYLIVNVFVYIHFCNCVLSL